MNSTLRWHLLHLPTQADPGVHFHVKCTGVHLSVFFHVTSSGVHCGNQHRQIQVYTSTLNLQVSTVSVFFHVTSSGVHCGNQHGQIQACIFPR